MRSQEQPRPRPAVLENVSKNLARLRRERGLTQVALAELSGFSRRMINAVENGAVNVSIATVDRLAAALDVSFTQLIRAPEATDSTRIEALGWTGKHPESRAVLLGAAPGHRETELWIWNMAPGERYESEETAGTWHELLLVLSGALTLTWEIGVDLVQANDFRIFSSDEPYVFSNAGPEPLVYVRALVL